MIRVLVVEDSPVMAEYLTHIINADPALHVIGVAVNGAEGVERARGEKPDVVTMDIEMPVMNGYEATRMIMETAPVPIIVITSTLNPADVKGTFIAMEAGAVAVLEKPRCISDPRGAAAAAEIVRTVRLMAAVHVVRRWPRSGTAPKTARPVLAAGAATQPACRIVAIGTSTGGPPVLRTILSQVPRDIAVPIVIVQHISPGFQQGLIDWLAKDTGFPVHIAAHNECLLPGHAYMAPDNFHLGVRGDYRVVLSDAPHENSMRPAASFLFRAIAREFGGSAIGVLLTGMGCDGAAELGDIKRAGGMTMAQDCDSSVVHGMPGEAIKMGSVTQVLTPDEIAATLTRLLPRLPPPAIPDGR